MPCCVVYAALVERLEWSSLALVETSFVDEALQLAAPLMAQLTRTGGVNYVAIFVLYLAATQEQRMVNEFAAQVRQYAPGTGGDVLTYAEELRQEGRREGEIKGRIETIENLLRVGHDWSLITRATGITPEEFQRLKARLNALVEPTPAKDASLQ